MTKPDRPNGDELNETSRDWKICDAVDGYRAAIRQGCELTLSDFLKEVGWGLVPSSNGAEGAGETPIGENTPYWSILRSALSLPVEDQHKIATDLAANCGYELTGDAYSAPPQPAPDAMREAINRLLGYAKTWDNPEYDTSKPSLSEDIKLVCGSVLPSAPVPSPDGAGDDFGDMPSAYLTARNLSSSGAVAAEPVDFKSSGNSDVEGKPTKGTDFTAAPPVRGDREEGGKRIWDSQRHRLNDQTCNAANRSWRSKELPDSFWEGFCLDADAILSLPSAPVSGRDAVMGTLARIMEFPHDGNSSSQAMAQLAREGTLALSNHKESGTTVEESKAGVRGVIPRSPTGFGE